MASVTVIALSEGCASVGVAMTRPSFQTLSLSQSPSPEMTSTETGTTPQVRTVRAGTRQIEPLFSIDVLAPASTPGTLSVHPLASGTESASGPIQRHRRTRQVSQRSPYPAGPQPPLPRSASIQKGGVKPEHGSRRHVREPSALGTAVTQSNHSPKAATNRGAFSILSGAPRLRFLVDRLDKLLPKTPRKSMTPRWRDSRGRPSRFHCDGLIAGAWPHSNSIAASSSINLDHVMLR